MMLTVLEHQKIYIGKNRDVAKPQISYEDANLLRAIELNNSGIFKWGNHCLIPQQWVGVVSLPSLSIEILPKVIDEQDDDFCKKILLQMFKVANDIPTKGNVPARVEFIKNGLMEILITNFLGCIEYYVKEGLISSYCKVTNNLSTIKGSINFSKQINKNLLNSTKFVCQYSKMDIDNNINRLLRYVLKVMGSISCDYNNKRRINVVLTYFANVMDVDISRTQNINIPINKVNQRIQILVKYARFFLEGYSVSVNNGSNAVFSMLFDMNKVFEKFIYKSYKKIFGEKIQYQNTKNYLLINKSNYNKKINLRPDLLLYSPSGDSMVIDTKWKRILKFVNEVDVYQMNAYVSAIDKIDTAVLLYPKVDTLGEIEGDYEFGNSLGGKALKIRMVDLSLIENETDFLLHLQSLLL